MKYLPFVCLLLIDCPLALFAQSSTSPAAQYGVVSQALLKSEQYSLDSTAGAYVVFDIGESFFEEHNGGLRIRFTRTTRIKLFNQSELSLGNISIPYYRGNDGRSEVIRSIEAASYNLEDGRIVKSELTEDQIFSEKINDHWKSSRFAIPNVRAGTVIEYRYELVSPYHFNLPDWAFQREIPTQYSEYQVSLVPFYEYMMILKGANAFDLHEEYEKKGLTRTFARIDFHDYVHRYVMEEVPAFSDESFITTKKDHLIKLDFQLSQINQWDGSKTQIISTWPALCAAFLKYDKYGKFIGNCSKFAKTVLKTNEISTNSDPLETYQKLVRYVKENFQFDGQHWRFAQQSAKKFWESKTGNATEINLFLVSLLREAGLEAHPILISTRDHGRLHRNYPFEHMFNSTLVQGTYDGRAIIMDATDPLQSFLEMPLLSMNGEGLIVSKKEPQWIKIPPPALALVRETYQLKLGEDLSKIEGSGKLQMTGYEARAFKSAFDDDEEKLDQHLTSMGLENSAAITTENFDNALKPYSISFDFNKPLNISGNKLYLNLFLDRCPQESPFKLAARTYPVDMIYPTQKTYLVNIDLGEKAKIIHLPESFELQNKLVHMLFEVTAEDGMIRAKGMMHWKKSVYQPNEYKSIKSHYREMIEKFNEMAVVEFE